MGFIASLISEEDNAKDARDFFKFHEIYQDQIYYTPPVSIEYEIDPIFDYLIRRAKAINA
mgnify:CR=1 FL=1